ncbi:M48 family metallopeptidase [Pedobacter sp. JCM 36344]|uniref:M48 family metallopeptidase n=1 Tax=Pedobacter sp. JCM 36344 TaxID=3374280 RepID=UPI00397E6A09
MINEFIQFGSKQIDFQLTYSDRKSLGITITPEMEVLVKAPTDTPLDKVKEKVKKRAPWIIKQLSFFLSFHPKTPERKYVGGETHLYLGRQYRLEVTIGNQNEVKYKGRFIEIITKDKINTKSLLKQWYRDKAKIKFAEIAEPLIQRFKKYNVEPKGLFIQEMPTRWGSCTTKGKIILNPELIKAPKPCIEYVIIHELCHLIYHNHTQKFIDLQTKEMRDWEKWKMKLEALLA